MDNLVLFHNVNELPRVPENHRRDLIIIGDNWYYEDIGRIQWTDMYHY